MTKPPKTSQQEPRHDTYSSTEINRLHEQLVDFQKSLIAWFEREGRHFPWRLQNDPYIILIAEKLLQQTAARPIVVQIFSTFVQHYPTPQDLAQASLTEIQQMIQPLGFIYRAQELIWLGGKLVERYDGQVPHTLKELLALPGVGDYAARAILSFAFGEDVPIVDTNVARFLYRLYDIPGRMPSNPARKKSLIQLAATLVPAGKSKEYNLAVLDLCASICTPTNPKCPICPVKLFCTYGARRLGVNSK